MADLSVSGSLRNRLALTLIGGAAVLAILLFFAVRNYAVQVAQQGQNDILQASVTSMLDAAVIRNNKVELDLPYSAFSMLATPADDQVFYAILQDGIHISGYDDLVFSAGVSGGNSVFETGKMRGVTIRKISASKTLIGANQRIEIQIVLAQTQDALSDTLDQISRNAAVLGIGFFALAAALSFWASSATIGQLGKLTSSVSSCSCRTAGNKDTIMPTKTT